MANDPAFLFYPGDYLRDTQCLSEKAQVAYDRIMCEHMRNISEDITNITISQDKHKFFTKRLSQEEKEELNHVLKKTASGFQIEWVALSICNRKNYSLSRAKNRSTKNKFHMKTYVEHMENENEIENVDTEFPKKPTEKNCDLVLPENYIQKSIEYLDRNKQIKKSEGQISVMWEFFKLQNFTGKKYYGDKKDIYTHFLRTLNNEKGGINQTSNTNSEPSFDRP